MPICTFFGHRDCPDIIEPILREVIISLIRNYNVNKFYVGNQGSFDYKVKHILRDLAKEYPYIDYSIVLAYIPIKQIENSAISEFNTILPEGIENVPLRFAISWRNKWMLKQSEYVVTYVTRSFGGAAIFAEMAKKQKKNIINIADRM